MDHQTWLEAKDFNLKLGGRPRAHLRKNAATRLSLTPRKPRLGSKPLPTLGLSTVARWLTAMCRRILRMYMDIDLDRYTRRILDGTFKLRTIPCPTCSIVDDGNGWLWLWLWLWLHNIQIYNIYIYNYIHKYLSVYIRVYIYIYIYIYMYLYIYIYTYKYIQISELLGTIYVRPFWTPAGLSAVAQVEQMIPAYPVKLELYRASHWKLLFHSQHLSAVNAQPA